MQNSGFDILDRLESDLKGTLEHDDLPGWGASDHDVDCGTACGLPTVGGAWESESAGTPGRTTRAQRAHQPV